jgi:DNA-binding CsgD family transcriptional regulator
MLSRNTARALRIAHGLFEARDDQAWNAGLGQINELLNASQTVVIGGADGAPTLASGSDPAFVNELVRHAPSQSPYLQSRSTRRILGSGRAFHGHELVPERRLRVSRYYRTVLRPWGDLAHSIGMMAEPFAGARVRMVVYRPASQAFTESERSRLELLAPPILFGAGVRLTASAQTLAAAPAVRALDALCDPLFVTGPRGELMHGNAAALDLIAHGSVFRLRDGALRVLDARGHDTLEPACARALSGQAPVAVRSGRTPGSDYFVSVTALPAGPGASDAGTCLIVARAAQRGAGAPSPAPLRDWFGASPAEARVAVALASGDTVEEVAQRQSLRADTIRQHIKRLLAKTGARRQADLVRLLLRTMPDLRVDGTVPEASTA